MNSSHSNDLEIDNLPNRITIFRMLLIPVVIGLLYLEKLELQFFLSWGATCGLIAGWIFIFASITDFVDGYIARKRDITTVFGSFLDPIADKFLIVSSLIMLDSLERVSALVVITLVLREFYITSLRLLAQHEGLSVPVSELGKWKTAMQMVAIPMLMANGSFFGLVDMYPVGTVFIYGATALSLYSAVIYSANLVKRLKEKRSDFLEKQ